MLKPIWTTKTETADRARGRIERILDYATTHHYREVNNPAQWKGHLSNILPKPSSVAKVQHHAAIEWQKIQPVIVNLQKSDRISALDVQFLCLCASRSSEVRFTRWEEIDLDQAIWTIPDHRMKTNKEHRVPLSHQAVEILEKVQSLKKNEDNFLFPSIKTGKGLSDVAEMG